MCIVHFVYAVFVCACVCLNLCISERMHVWRMRVFITQFFFVHVYASTQTYVCKQLAGGQVLPAFFKDN